MLIVEQLAVDPRPARKLNPLLSGWIEYYGRYAPSALSPMLSSALVRACRLARVVQ
jgi:hypothetical protein